MTDETKSNHDDNSTTNPLSSPPQSNPPPSKESSIPPQDSERICHHMNQDHAATVYAMVLSALSKNNNGLSTSKLWSALQEAKMTSVSLESYTLAYVLCEGGMCSMQKKITVPLAIPSRALVKKHLVEEHHRVLTPQFSWLYTDPLTLSILTFCLSCGYLHYTHFFPPSSTILNTLTAFLWYTAVIAHYCEAMYAFWKCRSTLQLRFSACWRWFVIVWLAGLPVLGRVKQLVEWHEKGKEGRKKD